MTERRTVTTVHGNRYRLGRELGRGGQGTVFAVEGERLAVKLRRDCSLQAQERLRDQLAMVGRLPLEDLAVARPIEHLRSPDVGYVMELFTGMVPLRSLLRPPQGIDSVTSWYFATGGLRRRLKLLARAAEVFAELHGRGLVYVDPSPDNVFVSEAIDAFEVRLIDTDNLRTSTAPGRILYTPGYGAPEIVRQGGAPSSLSDSYSFSLIAFEALTLAHPFLGDPVQRGEPEMEERALAGELPWIDDPADDCNRATNGIPREHVLSDTLRESFQLAFGVGRTDPAARPGMVRWVEYLHRAADRTLSCPSCAGSYYFNRDQCPWCDDPRPAFVIGAVLLWDPAMLRNRGEGQLDKMAGVVRDATGKPRVVDAVVVPAGEQVLLTDRLVHGNLGRANRLRVRFAGDRIKLEAVDGQSWRLISSDGRRERELTEKTLEMAVSPSGAAWILHSGPAERLHRVLRFDLRAGGAR
jgi:DNA-binding helix-hairpin-helix protein with protein kinase domain